MHEQDKNNPSNRGADNASAQVDNQQGAPQIDNQQDTPQVDTQQGEPKVDNQQISADAGAEYYQATSENNGTSASKTRQDDQLSSKHDNYTQTGNAWRDAEGHYVYRYPHPAVATDAVVFGFDGTELKILLILRKLAPYKDYWALPGGFLMPDETVEACVRRELREETSLDINFLDQFRTYSNPGRDPRERVISVAFCALVRSDQVRIHGGDDAAAARWFSARLTPVLAFDHQQIIDDALLYLRLKLENEPLAFNLLDKRFTMPQLQTLYEAVMGEKYDRRNFSRKMLQSGFIDREPAPLAARGGIKLNKSKIVSDISYSKGDYFMPDNEAEEASESAPRPAHRPASFFSFDKERYDKVRKSSLRKRFPFDL